MADDIKAVEHEGWLAVTARRHGWLVAKSTASHNSAAPKLFMVRGAEMLVVQARTTNASRKPLSDGQQEWLDEAGKVPGVEAVHWSPDDQNEAFARLTREAPDA
ncbi:MAG: hypothetical protein KA755_01595 [Candidatus Microthrix sp.]|nr:hypothetical protein [Candidatus Microthrix sp.]